MRAALLSGLLAASVFAQEPPYPPSPVIAGIDFDRETLVTFGRGSDQWPMTWGADGNIYAAWGDGWGWREKGSKDEKKSIGVTRLERAPPNLAGADLWGTGPGSGLYKPEALIALDDSLYMFWTSGDSKADEDNTHLAVSYDGGSNWTLGEDRAFPNHPDGFRVRGIVQHGPGNSGAPDNFVYVYFAHNRASDFYLARVEKPHVVSASRYEWFDGSGWTSDFAKKQPAFHDPNGFLWHISVAYNPGLKRYLLTKPHYTPGDNREAIKAPDSGLSSLGVFDAPTPWGPWTTVYYEDNFLDELVKFNYIIPAKFIDPAGRGLWLAFSGWPEYDSVSFVRATLRLR